MHAGGGEREDRIAGFEIGARQKLGALHGTYGESSEVIIAGGIEAWHLGGLAADQRASGLAAAFRNPGDDTLGNTDIELAGSEIVEKEERLGALHHEIVDVHGDEIDADPVMRPGLDGELELGADAIGVDLVAMCVNDLVVQGAEPLFFLDYFATGKLDVGVAARVIAGIAEGCREAGCALIGGETAEMPGLYAEGDYDLAGFAVGAVERGQAITGESVRPGDVVLGLASSGVHSNGYSLVRKVVADAGLKWSDAAPFASNRSLGEALLEPTRIYVKSTLGAARTGKVMCASAFTLPVRAAPSVLFT